MALEFQVPQFIDIEDKIFGSLTVKQFIYVGGGLGAAYLVYAFGGFFLAIIFGSPFVALGFALAFYKYNEQPFIKVMENFFNYNVSEKVYIWKQPPPEKKEAEVVETPIKMVEVSPISRSRLKDLSWSLDIKEKTK